jgi:multiple sugar transport system ATP-binding protein
VFYLVLENVTKAFKKTKVIGDASLTLERGESVVIVGPSGAGKTVLLRLIAGIYPIDSGDIRIDGRSVAGLPPEARGVGMAFQNFALYPHLSARENIASPLRARGLGDAEVRKRVGDVAELLKIAHVLEHEPRRLSNGQKQRTALARALVSGASLQMLDDPLRNVDAKLRYEMRFELPRLLKTFGASVLYVTQDYREAMAIADRIAVLIDGRLAQVARPEEIYVRPASVAVARLFGDPSINLAEVAPVAEHGGLFADVSGTRVRLDSADRQPKDLGPCWVGVRPDDLLISNAAGEGAIAARIVAVTPMHEKAVLLLRFADGTEWLAALPPNAPMASADDSVFVRFAPEAALLFDRATGLRVGLPHRRQAA